MSTKLYIVIPCHNEEAVLFETFNRLSTLFDTIISEGKITQDSKIVFIDDGSYDKTWNIISSLSENHERVHGIKLAKNYGHQNALLAGLMEVKDLCDCCISIDADLQDDIDAIPEFLTQFEDGCDVVYGVRKQRKNDTFFKRTTAHLFYKFMKLLGADVLENHADYRLMSRKALNALSEFPEVNLFLRGMVRLLGFKSGEVYYDRLPRFSGETNYPFRKMISFAFDGISSFSIKPIRLVWSLGVVVCIMAFIAAAYSVCSHFLWESVSGWTSLMISIWFIGGVQLISIGVIGEYIGKIYKEVKRRPRYIIEEKTK